MVTNVLAILCNFHLYEISTNYDQDYTFGE